MFLIGVCFGGCSFSRNEGPFANADSDDEITGSITSQAKDLEPTESDLAFARNAASDVLTKGDKDSSQPWLNPETGARGSVTPLAQVYRSDDGLRCRDFLASYVNGRTERWAQGAACQSAHGHWDIRAVKPWQQS